MALDFGQEYWPLTRRPKQGEYEKEVGIVFFDPATTDLVITVDKDIDAAKLGSWLKNGRLYVKGEDVKNPKKKK